MDSTFPHLKDSRERLVDSQFHCLGALLPTMDMSAIYHLPSTSSKQEQTVMGKVLWLRASVFKQHLSGILRGTFYHLLIALPERAASAAA
jgi:hypothetical protein